MRQDSKIIIVILVILYAAPAAMRPPHEINHVSWIIVKFIILGMILITFILIMKFSIHFSKILFILQKYSILHLVPNFKQISEKQIFLSQNSENIRFNVLFSILAGWALSVTMSSMFYDYIGINEESLSDSAIILMAAVYFTPIAAFLVFPIVTIDASNVRVVLKTKNIIVSASTPFRILVGGFSTLGILGNNLLFLFSDDWNIAIEVMFASLIPWLFLSYMFFRENGKISTSFCDYMKTKGIVKKELNLEKINYTTDKESNSSNYLTRTALRNQLSPKNNTKELQDKTSKRKRTPL